MRAILFSAALCLAITASLRADDPVRPLGLDLYRPVPDENPMTPARIDLGRRLFRDRELSRDGSMACATCHDPKRAFTDSRVVGAGVGGMRGSRNVPTLVNRAWGRSFFWDGRAATLEDQALQPLLNPSELGMTRERIVATVHLPHYRRRFDAAFPAADSPSPRTLLPVRPGTGAAASDADERTLRQVAFALAAYVRTIQSGGSPFDRFVNGDRKAISASAVRGRRIFEGKGGCSICHNGPTFSDERFHNTGVAWRSGALTDEGRVGVTGQAADRGAFKTPTLRDVGRTAPYMHDGSFATLSEVIDFYERGGVRNPGRDFRLRPIELTPQDKQDLLAFLRALSGVIRDAE